MGIFIHLAISKSTTPKEWKAVYEETLQLIKAFPLSEHRTVQCNGIDTYCLVRTQERKYKRRGEELLGWFADGDYETMRGAEDYSLSRNWIEDEDVEKDAGDAMLGILPSYLEYDWDHPLSSHIYRIWGNKSQGEPYHMYLLAIACLIEARLGNKAFVYGDITRGQCKKAVELANEHLINPIEVPDRCDMERLWKRVSALPICIGEQMKLFESAYLGTKDAAFGKYLRSHYPEELFESYWRKRFEGRSIKTRGVSSAINQYLLWGFDLEKLCNMVQLVDEKQESMHEAFVQRIMDAKLHWKEKDCRDILSIAQEEPDPYTINTFMAQLVFGGAQNKKVDRYIPLEEIRQQLKMGIGEAINVDLIVDNYLKKEAEIEEIGPLKEDSSEEEFSALCVQDASSALRQIMDMKQQKMIDERKKYDITEYDDLLYFEKGDMIIPNIEQVLIKSYKFYRDVSQEENYQKLMEQPVEIRCKWLTEQNRSIYIRDKDWIIIFNDIEKNQDSFSRYYPMVRVRLDAEYLREIVKAIVLNDDLYMYCEDSIKEDN